MNIYLISGLGADRTVWRNLEFGDGNTVHHLDWIKPIPAESLRSYALRMATAIDKNEPFYLIGLSFGGMLAAEITTELKPVKTILISSSASRKELPWYFKVAGNLRLNYLIPPRNPGRAAEFVSPFFGIETEADRKVFRELLQRADPYFSKWAIGAILHWDRHEAPEGLFRIHGTTDRVLPPAKGIAEYMVKDGGHFMVFNRAAEISKILTEIGIN